jgi:AcrR family transcriptional regulator
MADQLRADARSNRDQILAAARALFREQGIEVPMKEIADRAGVGVGTLYRRFPDRGALIRATAYSYLAGLADLVESIRREEPDAWSALCRLLRESMELRLGALASAVEPGLHEDLRRDPNLEAVRAAAADGIAELTAQAQAEGSLRADVTVEHIGRLMTLHLYVAPGGSYFAAVGAVLDIVLDGLRSR